MPYIIVLALFVAITAKSFTKVLKIAVLLEHFSDRLLASVSSLAAQIFKCTPRILNTKHFRFAVLGTVVAASVIFIVFSLISDLTFGGILDIIFNSTSLGQILDLADADHLIFNNSGDQFSELEHMDYFLSNLTAQFTFVSLLSLGISSFLSFFYMRCTLETIREFNMNRALHFLLVILFNLAFIIISGILVEWIHFISLTIADGAQGVKYGLADMYHTGMHSFWDIPKALLSIILLLILFLIALYLLILTAREVLATLVYGSMALLFVVVLCLSCFGMLKLFPNAPEWFPAFCYSVVKIMTPLVMLIPDYIRSTESLKQRLLEKVRQK